MTGTVTSRYTRVTVVGRRRRIDLVLPSEETVGRLMPEVLHLLGDPPLGPSQRRQLARLDGELLAEDLSLASAGVEDGALLRVVASDELPPAPVIHDVTEEVVDDVDARAWRWGAGPRRWSLTAAVVGASVLAANLTATLDERPRTIALGVAALLLLMVGGALARAVHEPLGTAVTLTGGALAVYAAVSAPYGRFVVVVSTLTGLALLVLVLGLSTPLGRGGVIGGGVALLVLLGWVGVDRLDLPPDRAGGVLALFSVILLGWLPRVALATSGLAGLDDRRARDEPVRRPSVAAAMSGAHRGLTLATVAVATSAGAAGWLLLERPGRWTVPLAVLLGVVLAARSRGFPLVGEVVAVLAATAAVILALLATWLAEEPGARASAALVLIGIAAVALLALVVRPAEHLLAALRRVVDRLEGLATVAMVPVVVGVFGLYGYLLDSF